MPFHHEWLPGIPSDITASWLESCLGHKIKSIEKTRDIYGTGTKLFYTITYADDSDANHERPTHICIKGVFDPEMLSAQPWTLLLAQGEAKFFHELAPKIKHMGYPKCWWSGVSDKQGLVIMNDLNAEGCTFKAMTDTWPVEKVMEGVEQIAGLHAQFWGAKVEDHPYAVNLYDASMQFICAPWDAVTHGPDRPPSVPAHLKDGARFNAAHDKYLATRNPRFATILHGDTHVGNTYLTAGGRPRWLDWSAVHIGSCFHDVSYFLCGALAVEDRRRHDVAVLRRYLDALHRLGGPRLSADDDEVMVEFRRSFIANCIWVVCPYELQPKESVAAMCERTVAAWEDWKVIELIESQPDPPKAS